MGNFFELYDLLIQGIPEDVPVSAALAGQCWTAVEAGDRFGLAMTTLGSTIPPAFPGEKKGMSLGQLAQLSKSWNLEEAGYGMAAINAWYNTPENLERYHAYEPFENYCTQGLDLNGRDIGVVGHLNMPASVYESARSVRILERNPRPGDYPDSACDWLLPQCDVVIITASTLVNKTLPHLLELCRNSYTILAGPTCPLCPGLLALGIDRIAGLVVTDREGMAEKIRRELPGPPYPMGKPFLLTGERL